MEYMSRLIGDMKFEVFFLTYQRHLIKFVMKAFTFQLQQNRISGKLLRPIKRLPKWWET